MKIILSILILFSLGILSCYDVDEYLAKRKSDKNPYVQILPVEGINANGVDLATVKLVFPVGPQMDCTMVSFSATEGVFEENKKSEFSTSDIFQENDGTLSVYASLQSTTNTGRFLVTVKTESIKITVPVTFNPSFPSKIVVDENKFAVKPGLADEIQLFANVKAPMGLPSKGTKIKFVVDGLSSDNSKWFRGLTTTDANGQASVFFSPGGLGTTEREIRYQAIGVDANKKEVIGQGLFDLTP